MLESLPLKVGACIAPATLRTAFSIEMVHNSTIPPTAVPSSGFATVTDVSLTQFPLKQSEM